MPTVRTIAGKAGVSITTVSRVLNNHPQVSPQVRKRVLAVTNKSGYTHTIGRKSTTNIALLYTGDYSLGSFFDGSILNGMSQGIEEYGCDLMILDARRSLNPGETFTQMMLRKGVRGAVVRTTTETRDVVHTLAAEAFPFVVVADRFDEPSINYVYTDSTAASRDAVEHLIGLGHKRIGICTNIVEDSDHHDRLSGYRQAMAEHGLPLQRRMIFHTPAHREGGSALVRQVLAMPNRPTALFLTDPFTVIGALSEARRLGVDVPGELSIVGFDDAELRYAMQPELTAVCQDACALGGEALRILAGMIDRLDDKNSKSEDFARRSSSAVVGSRPSPLRPATKKALRAWLEVHKSTAPPGAG